MRACVRVRALCSVPFSSSAGRGKGERSIRNHKPGRSKAAHSRDASNHSYAAYARLAASEQGRGASTNRGHRENVSICIIAKSLFA